jgi:hypothetical protein
MHPCKLVKRFTAGSAGFTLVEGAVSLFILSLAVTMVGQGIFQSLAVQRFWQDDVVATKDLRHATSYFAGDALGAQTINLLDGAPAATSATLTWTTKDGTTHTAIYQLSGDNLVRELDGVEKILAPRVVQVSFARTGQVVNFAMEVEAERGGTETINLQTYLRKLS